MPTGSDTQSNRNNRIKWNFDVISIFQIEIIIISTKVHTFKTGKNA